MVQAVRGMRDVLPAEARRWRLVESAIRKVLDGYAYEELYLPVLEFTELFARGVGEATDIVEKEMYSLEDRNGDSLSLRPEGTASCVRALVENGLLFNQTQRVFYSGPMFRYEKPQRGRYRQFNQVGAEAFGFAGPDIDAELIALCADVWERLGITRHVRLELNTLGSAGARQAYRDALVAYLTPYRNELDPDSQRRLESNPLRILDSKNDRTQKLLEHAPVLQDFVDADAREHFDGLQVLLEGRGIEFVLNPRLVRGLDYYTHTVFEWITEDLGSQGTICGGGRYDGLVERLGGRATPACGFSIGVDRTQLLHEVVHQDEPAGAAQVYVCWMHDGLLGAAFSVAGELREADAAVRVHMGGGALKKQLKRADDCGAEWAIILGDDEVGNDTVTIKHLVDGEQKTVARSELVTAIG